MRKSLIAALLAMGITSLSYGGDGSSADSREISGQGDERVLKVFDAQGKSAGPLLSLGSVGGISAAGVVLSVNGAIILAPIQRATSGDQITASQYEWSNTLSIFMVLYPSTDCSGPPFIIGVKKNPGGDIDMSGTLRPSVVVRQGSDATAYIAPDTYSTDITALSASLNQRFAPAQCLTGPSLPPPPFIKANGWTPESAYSLTHNYPEPLSVHD